ncbi:hypothetical protein JD969_01600 [Planctomycetota bacterium]|nr:hypothetical protein JD969_01600 [Planctomycetota bacterium]
MRVLQALRLFAVSLAAVWASALITIGFAALFQTQGSFATLIGIAFIAAGEFVLMRMVADQICPKASRQYTSLLKLSAALTFLMATAGAVGVIALQSF